MRQNPEVKIEHRYLENNTQLLKVRVNCLDDDTSNTSPNKRVDSPSTKRRLICFMLAYLTSTPKMKKFSLDPLYNL